MSIVVLWSELCSKNTPQNTRGRRRRLVSASAQPFREALDEDSASFVFTWGMSQVHDAATPTGPTKLGPWNLTGKRWKIRGGSQDFPYIVRYVRNMFSFPCYKDELHSWILMVGLQIEPSAFSQRKGMAWKMMPNDSEELLPSQLRGMCQPCWDLMWTGKNTNCTHPCILRQAIIAMENPSCIELYKWYSTIFPFEPPFVGVNKNMFDDMCPAADH